MTQAPRTPQELQDAADHLHYELRMLYETAWIVHCPGVEGTIHDALLESCLLHARALFDFFDPPPKRKSDDVEAADFCPSGWSCPPWPADIARWRERINKELAHLTYKRYSKPEDKEWALSPIVAAFDAPVAELQKRAGSHLTNGRWKKPPKRPPLEVVSSSIPTAQFTGVSESFTLLSTIKKPKE